MAGSSEGLSNERNQPHALLCARNWLPLLNLYGIFSNNIFGLYGLGACPTLPFVAVERSLSERLLTTISWGMILTSPPLLARARLFGLSRLPSC